MSKSNDAVLTNLSASLAGGIGHLTMREHAALRRMNPLMPGMAAMIACRVLMEQDVALDDDARLARWFVLLHALALARGAHDRRISIGEGLWKMNYTERRINQLLVADFDGLAQLVPRLARRLRASGGALDFGPVLRLLLSAGLSEDMAEKARLDIARSCARHQPKD